MNDIKEILSNHPKPIPAREFSRFLHDQHTLLALNKTNIDTFFSDLFSALSNKSAGYTDREMDQIRLIAYIFVIAFNPPPKLIDTKLSSSNSSGFLISTSFVLYSMQKRGQDALSFFHEIFSRNINNFFPKETVPSFYSITPCHHFKVIPNIFEDIIFDSELILNDFFLIFQQICDLAPENLTNSIIIFTTDVYKAIKNRLMNKSKDPLPEYFTDAFVKSLMHIMVLSQRSPTILLSSFFHTWFFLVNKCLESLKTQALLEYTPIITKCFEKTATCKYHELHRIFPWYLSFWFFNYLNKKEDHIQRVRVLAMICSGIRTVSRMSSLNLMNKSIKMFSSSLISLYSEQNPYYLYYTLTSLDSSLGKLTIKTAKIHAIGKISPDEKNYEIRKRQMSFHEQSKWANDSPIYDFYLFSNINEIFFSNEKLCIDDFDNQLKICEKIRKFIQAVIIFQEEISIIFRDALLNEIKNDPGYICSTPFHYLLKTFSTMVQFMILSSHRQMEIQTYANKEVFKGKLSMLTPQQISSLQDPQRLLDFSMVYQKYFDVLETLPFDFIQTLAVVFSNEIVVAIEKGTLSLNFIHNFHNLLKGHINDPKSLYTLVINHLMEIASVKLPLLMSQNVKSVIFCYSLIVSTIRMAQPDKSSNLLFGYTLKLYQRLLLVSIFQNMKCISHQTIAARLINHFFIALDENFHEENDTNGNAPLDRPKSFRIKPANIEEFEAPAKSDIILTVLELVLRESDFMSIQLLIPILDSAFATKEHDLVEKAAKVCLKFFKTEDPEVWNNNSSGSADCVRRLFKQFFDSIKTIDHDIASEVIELMPKYASVFLHNPPLLGNEEKVRFLMDDVGIDLLLVLKEASSHMNYSSKDEASYLYTLTSCGFEIVVECVVKQAECVYALLLQLITILKHLFGFKCILDSLKKLTSYITKSFGDLFISSESNLYILCVFDAMGLNRSDSTLSMIDLAISFFEYIKNKPNNPLFIMSTVESLFSFFPLSTRLFSMLCGFSVLIRYYPEYINLCHIRSFLIQTTDIYPLDNAFMTLLNQFLKEFFSNKNSRKHHAIYGNNMNSADNLNSYSDEENSYNLKRSFLTMIYDIICPLSMGVRRILEKRISKFNVPIPFKSLDEIYQSSSDEQILVFQKLTIAFLCNIEGNLLSDLEKGDWVNKVLRFMNLSSTDGVHRFEKFSRILSLTISILKNPEIFHFFFSKDKTYIVQVLHFLCNTLMSHFPPVQLNAKKCFNLIKKKYMNELRSVTQIDDFWRMPTKIFSFWGKQPDRIGFYTRLTKIMPEKTPIEVVTLFLDEIPVYVNKSENEKMILITNFVKILKQFTVKKYITQEPIMSIILQKENSINVNSSENKIKSRLEHFIDSMLLLFKDPNIPFRALIFKPVLKFFSLFPSQTIDYLVNSCNDNSLVNYLLLEELIINNCRNNKKNDNYMFSYKYKDCSNENKYETNNNSDHNSNNNNFRKNNNSDTKFYEENIFFNCFLALFEAPHNFTMFSPALYRIFIKLTLEPRFVLDSRLLTVLQREFTTIVRSFSEPAKKEENALQLLTILTTSIIQHFEFHPDLPQVFALAQVFQLSFFANSDLYKMFISTVFRKSESKFISKLLKTTLQSIQKLPTIVLEIVLPNCLKVLPAELIHPKTLPMIWEQVILLFNDPNKVVTALKSSRYLMSKSNDYNNCPTKVQLSSLLGKMSACLTSVDVQTVIYSLKLCIKLATFGGKEKSSLPPFIYEAIVRQLFSYQKFFESPYTPYSIAFLNSMPEMIDKLSPETIETVSYFFYDKFWNFREMQKSIPFIVAMTDFFKILPFSFLTAISNFIDQRLINAKLGEEPPDVCDILNFCVPFYTQVSKSDEYENKMFFNIGFKYIRVVLNMQPQKYQRDFSDNFFNLLLDSKIVEFPTELIKSLNLVKNSTGFGLICSAVHYIPDIILMEHQNLVFDALKFVSDEQNQIHLNLLTTLLTFIFKKKEIYTIFSQAIYSIINFLISNYSLDTCERLFLTTKFLISNHYDSDYKEVLNKLWMLYQNLSSKTNSSLNDSPLRKLYQMLLKYLEIILYEEQSNYFEIIMNSTLWNDFTRKLFTNAVSSLLVAPTIMNSVRKQILITFPSLISGTIIELKDIIESVGKFGESSKTSVIGYQIFLEILIASKSRPSEILSSLERIEKMINNCNYYYTPLNNNMNLNMKRKFIFFIENLPLILWSNQYLIYIVALLTEKVKIWQPMFAFSTKLKNCGVSLAISAFKNVYDPQLSIEFQKFLKVLLLQENNGEIQYTQVISSILQTFYQSGDNMFPYSLSFSASCVSGDFEFDHRFFSNTVRKVPSRFIFPDMMNHTYFGLMLPQLTHQRACAAALTLLNQYKVAEFFYQIDECSDDSYYGQIRKINKHLIEPKKNCSYEEIFQPLMKIDKVDKKIQRYLSFVKEAFEKKDNEKIIEFNQKIQNSIFESYRLRKHTSIYQNERVIVIKTLSNLLLKLVNNESVSLFEFNKKYAYLNPSFINLIKNFYSYLSKETLETNISIDSKEPPSVLIAPMIYSDIKTVSGITSHGLYSLNISQINDKFNSISKKITDNQMKISDWRVFAPFCFNIFLAQQTQECFGTAFGAYCQIFISKEDIPQFLRQEASARIITLIRISIQKKGNDDLSRITIESSSIFQKQYAEIWRYWLQQLIELSKEKWFFDIVVDLFLEMTYRSTLYAKKYANKDLQDMLHFRITSNEHNTVQISMMEKIVSIIKQIYNGNVDQIERQENISHFIKESLSLPKSEIGKIDQLIKLRQKKKCFTSFELALSKLMKDEILQIGDFQNWVEEISLMTDEQKELYIQNFTKSSDILSRQKEHLANIIDNFNNHLPYIFPIKSDTSSQISIFRFHKDLSYLSPDMILCRASTSGLSRQTFLVQRSQNEMGFHASVMTLSIAFFLFRVILQNSYPSRMRAITLAAINCFEMGENILLMPLMSEPISLKDLFERENMISQSDWVAKFTNSRGEITKEGLENVKTFTNDSLKLFHADTMPEKTFLRLRSGLAKSYAAAAVVRHMFSTPYSDMSHLIACTKAAEIPILHIDFDNGNSFLNEDPIWSTFRLSPTIELALGNSAIGELFLSMASVAHAFTTHLEGIRTYLELIVCDEMSDSNYTVDEIVRQRTIIENRFISLSPPTTVQATKDECLGWYDNIMKLIEKSKDPFVQPANTIPWF